MMSYSAHRSLLDFLLYSASVDLCHPSLRAYREDLERLALHPEPAVAGRAAELLAEIADGIAARERDWGRVC